MARGGTEKMDFNGCIKDPFSSASFSANPRAIHSHHSYFVTCANGRFAAERNIGEHH
jgi:hypothetical protein